MKRIFCYSLTILITATTFSACKKDSTPVVNYTSGQGKITGSGGASFSVENTGALFIKVADTITLQAKIDPSANVGKTFILGMVVKNTGTVTFNNLNANPTANYTSGALAVYTYESTNSVGTIIAHEYFVKSGSVNVTAISSSNIAGTYNATLGDANNNGDPDITINGTFEGNF